MRRKFMTAACLAALAATFVAGYCPQRRARLAQETEATALRSDLRAATARVRMAELLGQVLLIRDLAMRQDYYQASVRSSGLFDDVRSEVAAMPDDELSSGLKSVLTQRDAVTAALAKGDASVIGLLREIELGLRGTLGYSLPAESGSAAPPP